MFDLSSQLCDLPALVEFVMELVFGDGGGGRGVVVVAVGRGKAALVLTITSIFEIV